MDRIFETTPSETPNENVVRAIPQDASGSDSHGAAFSQDTTSRVPRSRAQYVVRARFSGETERLVIPDERTLFLDENDRWSSTGKPRRFESRDAAAAFVRARWPQFWNREDASIVIDILAASDALQPFLPSASN